MKCFIVVSSPGVQGGAKHYLCIDHVCRVKEIEGGCMIIMTDGSKYTFNKDALEVVDLISGRIDEEEQAFMDAPPGTEVEQ